MVLHYGWCNGKFVLLVTDDKKTTIHARISLSEAEVLCVKHGFDDLSEHATTLPNHEQVT